MARQRRRRAKSRGQAERTRTSTRPALADQPDSRRTLVVGLTGTIASGKGTVAALLEERGFRYFSLSDRVREEATRRGVSTASRKQLQRIGNDMRQRFGSEIWARRTLDRITASGVALAVVDGIRNPREARYLRGWRTFYLVGVDAPRLLRFKRLARRRRRGDPKTFEGFVAVDQRDRGIGEGTFGQRVGQCLDMADFIIRNDSGMGKAKRAVERIVRKLTKVN